MAESDPLRLDVDAVLVPRATLNTIALALAAIIRVSGEGLSAVIDRLDRHDGLLDPDEPNFDVWLTDHRPGDPGDHESGADEEEAAWVEWHTQRANTRTHCLTAGHEDAEEDDAPEEDDGDSAVDDRPCDDIDMDLEPDNDMEIEQMPQDVPALPVFGPFNIFNDKRTFLGMNAERWIGKPYTPT